MPDDGHSPKPEPIGRSTILKTSYWKNCLIDFTRFTF